MILIKYDRIVAMNNIFFTGVDMGSEKIKIFSLPLKPDPQFGNFSKASVPSQGILNGYIQNKEKVSESLQKSLINAENKIQRPITKALFGINSSGLTSRIVQTTKVLSRNQIEITDKILNDLEKNIKNTNINPAFTSIIFRPIEYNLDGFKNYMKPTGSIASKISIKYLQVLVPLNHIKMIENVAELTDIEIINIVPTALASSFSMLKDHEKESGVLYIDFGHNITSFVFMKNNQPHKIKTIDFGSDLLSREIALKLKISKKNADDVKKRPPLDAEKRTVIGKIISFYIKRLYTEINKDIERINGKNNFFASGIVLSGAGSRLSNIEDIFSKYFRMPVRKITDPNIESEDTSYTGAYSLSLENKKLYHKTISKNSENIFSKLKNFFE